MNEIYEEYAILDAKIKVLSDKKDELRVKILEDLVNNELPMVATTVGKFTVSNLKSWTYSPEVEDRTDDLKALKAREESVGIATYEEKPSLRFTPVKF